MFYERISMHDGKDAIRVWGLGSYSLKDTFECGQCFRYELIREDENYTEYMTVVGENIITVAQFCVGELYFIGMTDEDFKSVAVPYFTLQTDYEAIKQDIISKTSSDWLKKAADAAGGIAILKQDPWETLFSFIISQNNNIPRIKGIVDRLCRLLGEHLGGDDYAFPTAEKVAQFFVLFVRE